MFFWLGNDISYIEQNRIMLIVFETDFYPN